MALLIHSYDMGYERIVAALEQTFARRDTHELTDKLNSPPQEWDGTFEVLAKQCNLEGDIRTVFSMVYDFYENAQKEQKSKDLLVLKS